MADESKTLFDAIEQEVHRAPHAHELLEHRARSLSTNIRGVCRALKVLCVAQSDEELSALRRSIVSAEWELTPGATDELTAMAQIDIERPHVLIAFGPFARLVELSRERFPGMRIITDRQVAGASAVADGLRSVRDLVKGLPAPGGPVGS